MKKKFILTAALFSAVIFASCAQKTASNEVSIMLPSNPTTGSSWTAEIEDKSVALLQKDEYKADKTDSNLLGSGGTQILTFKLLKPGETKITLTYAQNWSGGGTWEKRYGILKAKKNPKGKLLATIEILKTETF